MDWRNLWGRRRDRMERDLERELRDHVERRTADLVRSGLSLEEARRQAAIQFGGMASVQEEVRDTWAWRWLDNLARDVRFAARMLRQSPGFTATVMLSLALGIGANTAIFSVLHALVLRSLPVRDPRSLAMVGRPVIGADGVSYNWSFSYPVFRDLQAGARSLDALMAFRTTEARLSADGSAERITAALVSGNYFDALGVTPALGTAIGPEDDVKAGSGGWRGPVAVLGYGFWTRRFGARASMVGSRILLNGGAFTVVGVAPPGFEGTEVGESPDVYVPMMMQPVVIPANTNALTAPRNVWLRVIARRNPAVPNAQAEAELTALYQLQDRRNGGQARNPAALRIALVPAAAGHSPLRTRYAKPLWVVMAVMALVLMIACANVANLLLSRAAARRREIGVRLGLGAARSRLIVQLLTENLLLAVMGAACGLLLARWLRDVLVSYLPPERNLAVPLDLSVLAFTLALTVGTGFLFGLAPALASTKVDVASALRGGALETRPLGGWLRRGLMVLQIGLSCVLLMAASVFLRSLHNLLELDTGFTREKVLLVSLHGGMNHTEFYSRALEATRRMPGVAAAALADFSPLGNHTGWTIHIPGYVPKPDEPRDDPFVGWVSPGYFETMKLPVLLGRGFDARDVAGDRKVMVVNERFAKHYFEGQNPVGRVIGTSEGKYDIEIIGVVQDGKYSGLREGLSRMMYLPFPAPSIVGSTMVLHVRSVSSPAGLAGAIRQKVHQLDSGVPVDDVHTVEQEIDRSLSRERLVGTVSGMFGALALVVAAIGLYGMTAYGVSQRTREFGIRTAIGAQPASLVSLVLREGLWIAATGLAAGLAAAWAMGEIVRSLLFGVEPMDPWSALAAVVVLGIAALTATWIPARRASRVDPMTALRCQ